MLDYLITRNALSYQYFLEALCLTGNTHIANILDPEYSTSEECQLVMQRERTFLNIPITNHHHQMMNNNNNNQQEHTNLPYPVTCSQVDDSDLGHFSSSNFINRFLINQTNHSSRSTSQSTSSSSMSPPIMHRVRSNSVAALKIINRSSLARLLAEPSSSLSSPITNRTSFQDDDLSPARFNSPTRSFGICLSEANATTSQISQQQQEVIPSTYNLDWSHVNNLELDFTVYKTLPYLRKQLTNDECYQMEQMPRGLCLIINNEHFYDSNGIEMSSMRRIGTDMDASRLKNLFEKLYFQVEMFIDLKECEMRQALSLFANKCEMNSHIYDAICLIVLSHGTDGYVYGVDFENRLNMDKDILNMFDDILIGKPKLFIFQACRGEHLNQKDLTIQSQTIVSSSVTTLSHSKTTPVLSTASTSSASSVIQPCTSASSSGSPSSSSFCGSTLNPSNKKSNSLEEDTIKRFKQLKMSSLACGTLQMMYKKKCANTTSSTNSTTPSTSSTTSQPARVKKTIRSRSHSRGKYSSYLVSAASAIRTAIKTSPSSTKTILNSISTQTSSSVSSASISSSTNDFTPEQETELIVNANCYLNSNIITSTNTNQSLSNFIDGRPIKTSLPSRSDFFIWYSSVRGFVSHRDRDGSPFIKCLVTVFSRCAYELELIEMVRKVNLLMQQYEKKHFDERNSVSFYFMVPVAEYHLTKRLYFNP